MKFFKKLLYPLIMVYRPDMKLFYPLIIFITCIITGCATIKIEQKNVFPFRAKFEIKGNIRNLGTDLNGAMLISSSESGVSQIYGPGGIAVSTLKLENGNARLTDTWDKEISNYKVPVKDIAGLLAGMLPSGLICKKKNENGETALKYLWGDVILDKYLLPIEMNIKGKQRISAVFLRTAVGIDLMITWGTDNFIINVYVIEGGRWKDAESEMQDVR
jgi:hypothetical protein